MRPIVRPTRAKASSAYCRSSRVWVAVTIVRTRALSRATVGYPIACANTPSSNNRSDSAFALALSPAITGVIGTLADARIESEPHQSLFEETCVVPQPFHDFRLVLKNIERGDAGRRDGWRMRRRKQERPRPVIEKLDQVATAGHVPAQSPDRFRQRTDLDIHPAVHVEMVDRSPPVLPEHSTGMRIVDHHDAAGVFREITQRGQRAEVAIHAEHAIGNKEATLICWKTADDPAGGVNILVREHLDRRSAEAAPVDDAGVVQLVGDDDVVFGQDGRDGAGVGGETALKDDNRFDFLELGQPPLELQVNGHRSGNRPDRARSDAEFLDGLERPGA